MSFLLFLVGFMEIGQNKKNMGNCGGPMLWRREPHAVA